MRVNLRGIFSAIALILAVQAVQAVQASSSTQLDYLFEQLKSSPDEKTARHFENQVWLTWLKSGNEKVDAMMSEAMQQRSRYDFLGALETLQTVAAQQPEYPEVWNQLAIVEFHRGDHEKSLHHIARALELEPRHFGAMAGRAVIRLMQGKAALARQNIIEAMKLHPYLPERELFPGM